MGIEQGDKEPKMLDQQTKEDLLKLYQDLENRPRSRAVMDATLEYIGCYDEFWEYLDEKIYGGKYTKR